MLCYDHMAAQNPLYIHLISTLAYSFQHLALVTILPQENLSSSTQLANALLQALYMLAQPTTSLVYVTVPSLPASPASL